MHAVGHQHKVADALRVSLLAGQVARGLLVLYDAAEGSDAAARLEVEGSASSDQVVGGCPVSQT